MNFNKCIIGGHITRDIEVRHMPSGQSIAAFSVAVNERWKDKDTGEKKEAVSFIDCDAWGKTGEVIAQYFAKGKPILIEGRIKQETWEDKTSGQKRSKLKVVVESFSFCGGKGDGEEQPPATNTARQPAAATTATTGKRVPVNAKINDDDIPF